MFITFSKEVGCFPCECEKYAEFEQMWGSTALGFDGAIGGCAMTTAPITIIKHTKSETYGIFFDGKLAYILKEPNENFFTDVEKEMMASTGSKNRYTNA